MFFVMNFFCIIFCSSVGLFSLSAQVLPLANYLEDDVESTTKFYEETFGEELGGDELRVFKNVWTKKHWTRFPGKIYITPRHIAFYSVVGGRKFGGVSKVTETKRERERGKEEKVIFNYFFLYREAR